MAAKNGGIYYYCSFWSNVPFLVAVVYIAAKFYSSTSIVGGVIAVCAKSKMVAAAILDFIFVQYFGILACRTSDVIHVPNFVHICSIINER